MFFKKFKIVALDPIFAFDNTLYNPLRNYVNTFNKPCLNIVAC